MGSEMCIRDRYNNNYKVQKTLTITDHWKLEPNNYINNNNDILTMHFNLYLFGIYFDSKLSARNKNNKYRLKKKKDWKLAKKFDIFV